MKKKVREFSAILITSIVIMLFCVKTDVSAECEIIQLENEITEDSVMDAGIQDSIDSDLAEGYDASKALEYAYDHAIWDHQCYGENRKSCDNGWLCAEYVSNCINAGGISTFSRGCTSLRRALLARGDVTEYTVPVYSGYVYKSSVHGDVVPGDLIMWFCEWDDEYDLDELGRGTGWVHVGLISGFDDSGRIKVFAHNSRKIDEVICYSNCGYCSTPIYTACILHFNGNNGGNSASTYNKLPIGHLDGIIPGEGTINVYGWSYDENASESLKNLQIHIYVGGPAGSGSNRYVIHTGQRRTDVTGAYPEAYEDCGFDEVIKVSERGRQTIYVYAIDANDPDEHLSFDPITVNIPGPKLAISYDQKEMKIYKGKTSSMNFSFSGDSIYKIGAQIYDDSLIDTKAVYIDNLNYAKGSGRVTLTGIKPGTTRFSITLLDTSGNVLKSEFIPLTVISNVTKLTLNKSSLTLKSGDSETLSVSVSPSDASNKKIKWSSSNTCVTVSDGKITANKPGAATVTATATDGSGVTASCSITVKAKDFSLTYDTDKFVIYKDKTAYLNFKFSGDGIHGLGCSIFDPTLIDQDNVTIDSVDWTKGTGRLGLKGEKAGQTKVSIELMDSNNKVLLTNYISLSIIAPVESVVLSKQFVTLDIDKTETLTANIIPQDASDKAVKWESSDESVVTVNNGKITAVKPGRAIITVITKDGGKRDSCTVIVLEPSVVGPTSVTLNTDSAVIEVGTTLKLSAVVLPENSGSVTWYVYNRHVATVDSYGVVTGIKAGSTTIKVSVDNSNLSAYCDVTVVDPILPEKEKQEQQKTDEECAGIEEDQKDIYLVKGQIMSVGTNKSMRSLNPSVVRVKKNRIIALKEGVAVLESEDSNIICYVSQPYVDKKINLVTGNTSKVNIFGLYGNFGNYDIVWNSSKNEIAKVDNDGNVCAVSNGSAKIRTTINGRKYTCIVKVSDQYKWTGQETSLTLRPFQTVKLRTNGRVMKNYQWNSDTGMTPVYNARNKILYYKNDVVRVNPDGTVMAIGTGTTILTGSRDSFSKDIVITVQDMPSKEIYLVSGESRVIKLEGQKKSSSNMAVWSSDDENIVTVSQNGKVSASLSVGTANVICRYNPYNTTSGFTYVTVVNVQ